MTASLAAAVAKHGAGDARGALGDYQAILDDDPANARAWHYAGVAHHQLGDPQKAIGCLQRAAQLDPDAADSAFALGVAFQGAGKLAEAFARFERALIARPDFADAHNGIGAVCQRRGDAAEAERAYRRALAIDPKHADALGNLGGLLAAFGRFDAAETVFARLVRNRPDDATAQWQHGRALRGANRPDEALVSLDRAQSLAPDDPRIGYDRALSLLHLERYPEGFAAWECRTRRADMRPRPKELPVWDGGPIEGKRAWLFAEQGQGDLIQYLRYARLVAERGAEVIAEVHPGLIPVARTAEGVSKVVPYGAAPAADVLVPCLSLPRYFGTTVETVPDRFPYLSAPPGALPALPGAGRKIGLVWSGNPQQPQNRWRACAFDDLVPLVDLPETTFFSLQKGSAAADRLLHEAGDGVFDLGPSLTDFGVTARVLGGLDLLITTDTAIAHLAGALDRPAFLLLAHHADWRWGRGTDRSPWYRSLRLFRQTTPGDWAGVVARVRSTLAG